ncbi:MAG TPA: PEP/pyruvate-binding domain-containing protein [Anaerolineales bacterium]|nr:PEP/pyruvate-binding domain-containing protein [Anaerolineales bacterium]
MIPPRAARYVYNLEDKRLPASIGNKARRLHGLARKGFPVPVSFICTWEAHQQYQQGEATILPAIQHELEQVLEPSQPYAVRSSANVEDGLEFSFAGQFKTLLGVQEMESILQAIHEIWDVTHSAGVQAYLERHSLNAEDLKMAVIVQEMVKAVVSGVAFSKNPLTGLDEVLVEAVRGSGEALVQGGLTPARWVNKWGVWTAKPDHEDIDTGLIEKVVQGTRQIARTFKMEVDLEWVYDGNHLYWLQLREITAIKGLKVYSNRIAKEVLPGVIKPLIWSVNTPLVNSAWVRLITELIGENDIEPTSLSKAFYYRTYFDMSTFGRIFNRLGLPEESLEIIMGIAPPGGNKPSFKPGIRMIALLPRLLRFLIDKWNFSKKIEHSLPELEANFREFGRNHPGSLGDQELLQHIDRLFATTQDMAYLNIVAPLLMNAYNALFRRQLNQLGIDYESFDLIDGMRELQQFDPAHHLRQLHEQFQQLQQPLQDLIQKSSYQEFMEMPGMSDFQASVSRFLERFGHLSDSGNDFSSTPWRENPDLILNLVRSYSTIEERKSDRLTYEQLPVYGLRHWLLSSLYHRARLYRLHREQVSSLYTYGYGLFRNFFLALGEHLAQNGKLEDPSDIFYLYDREIRAVVEADDQGSDLQRLVEQRKGEIEAYLDIELPSLIYGEQAPPLSTAEEEVLAGTATSRGYYTGRVTVVKGIEDFNKVKNGDVLVVPFSDVGWTPLFAKAGAVIAESGGMLSHSSIIAREYQIPAVVSVRGAMRLLDNTLVSVDGFRGQVVVQESSQGSSLRV